MVFCQSALLQKYRLREDVVFIGILSVFIASRIVDSGKMFCYIGLLSGCYASRIVDSVKDVLFYWSFVSLLCFKNCRLWDGCSVLSVLW